MMSVDKPPGKGTEGEPRHSQHGHKHDEKHHDCDEHWFFSMKPLFSHRGNSATFNVAMAALGNKATVSVGGMTITKSNYPSGIATDSQAAIANAVSLGSLGTILGTGGQYTVSYIYPANTAATSLYFIVIVNNAGDLSYVVFCNDVGEIEVLSPNG